MEGGKGVHCLTDSLTHRLAHDDPFRGENQVPVTAGYHGRRRPGAGDRRQGDRSAGLDTPATDPAAKAVSYRLQSRWVSLERPSRAAGTLDHSAKAQKVATSSAAPPPAAGRFPRWSVAFDRI